MQHQEGNHNNTMAISTQMTEVKTIGCLTYSESTRQRKPGGGKTVNRTLHYESWSEL